MTGTPATADDLNWIRVDQVGSLCPPRLLHQVFEEYKSGKISESVLTSAKNRAIEEIVYKQQKIGLPILSDGELRRRNFQESFSASVTGFEVAHENKAMEGISTRPLTRAEQDFAAAGPAIVTRRRVTERLRLKRNVPLEEYLFASKYATSPVKVTVLSADRIAQRFAWEESLNIYATMDDFLADVVEISRLIIKGLVDAGCKYIQVDAPGYTAYIDDVSLERMRSRGEDPMDNMDKAIAADNAIIDGFENVTFGIHLCRGNPRTIDPETGKVVPQWHREGHYDGIAERLFSQLNHRRLLLEYDDERSGGFKPLRFIRPDACAVVGIVTTKRPNLESEEYLMRRIEDAQRFLSVDQIAISPQCGFGGLDHLVIPEDDQWRKFERLLEIAARIWN